VFCLDKGVDPVSTVDQYDAVLSCRLVLLCCTGDHDGSGLVALLEQLDVLPAEPVVLGGHHGLLFALVVDVNVDVLGKLLGFDLDDDPFAWRGLKIVHDVYNTC